jgi:peptidoglycan/xylan/chitin deacetylase (PgdA/CDA1 family)
MQTQHSTSPKPGRRRFLRTGRSRAIAAFVVLLAGGAWWYNEHRTISWTQTFSPAYWYRRLRGDDLYLADGALLMHGNRGLAEVALTFDDGPHRQSRGEILDTLKRYGVHATFFDVGRRMAESPDLVRRTLAEGSEIGNHSYNHYRLPGLPPSGRHREINDTDITFNRITGQHLMLLRPPGMRYNADVLEATKRMGYIVVGYSTASKDFDLNETPDFIATRTLRRTDNGGILLLHDYPGTAAALPIIIEKLRAQGYRFVTVSEMLAHLPERPRLAVERFRQAQAAAEARAIPPAPPVQKADSRYSAVLAR